MLSILVDAYNLKKNIKINQERDKKIEFLGPFLFYLHTLFRKRQNDCIDPRRICCVKMWFSSCCFLLGNCCCCASLHLTKRATDFGRCIVWPLKQIERIRRRRKRKAKASLKIDLVALHYARVQDILWIKNLTPSIVSFSYSSSS